MASHTKCHNITAVSCLHIPLMPPGICGHEETTPYDSLTGGTIIRGRGLSVRPTISPFCVTNRHLRHKSVRNCALLPPYQIEQRHKRPPWNQFASLCNSQSLCEIVNSGRDDDCYQNNMKTHKKSYNYTDCV